MNCADRPLEQASQMATYQIRSETMSTFTNQFEFVKFPFLNFSVNHTLVTCQNFSDF